MKKLAVRWRNGEKSVPKIVDRAKGTRVFHNHWNVTQTRNQFFIQIWKLSSHPNFKALVLSQRGTELRAAPSNRRITSIKVTVWCMKKYDVGHILTLVPSLVEINQNWNDSKVTQQHLVANLCLLQECNSALVCVGKPTQYHTLCLALP